MKQTIEINVPEGYTAKWNEETKQIDLVKNSTKSHSWGEFCENHPNTKDEWYIQSDSFIHMCYTTEVRRDTCKNNLETKEDTEGILALIQLTRLHDEWVNGWKADFSHTYYCINTGRNGVGVAAAVACNHLLSFPTRDMADEFFDCFKDLIETAKKFI